MSYVIPKKVAEQQEQEQQDIFLIVLPHDPYYSCYRNCD